MPASELVLTAEHAGRDVPEEFRALFAGREALLESHRGWDPGSLELARALADRLDAPLLVHETTRLLVEPNRSEHHPRLFSEITRGLDSATKTRIVERWYRPHRERVETTIRQAIERSASPVVHIGVHTFTPIFEGEERKIDVAWLYDPARPRERERVARLVAGLKKRRPDLRIRRNAPYRGASDGLTTTLRRRFPADRYLGLELEVSQAFPLRETTAWCRLKEDLAVSLGETLRS